MRRRRASRYTLTNTYATEDLVIEYFRLTPAQLSALAAVGISTIEDLLRHFPARYDVAGKYGDRTDAYGRSKGYALRHNLRAQGEEILEEQAQRDRRIF